MATAAVRRRTEEPFDIHEDVRTEETEMIEDDKEDGGADVADTDVVVIDDGDEDDGEGEGDEEYDSSDDEQVDRSVQSDMKKLESDFPGFWYRYRLIKRIGEGMCTCCILTLGCTWGVRTR